MPIFSNLHKKVFFSHIPKTGGTSLENAVKAVGIRIDLWSNRLHGKRGQGFPCSPQHWHKTIIDEIFSGIEHDFAVVRHPLDRIVSEFKHRSRWAIKHGRQPKPFGAWLDFVFANYENDPYFLDNHLRPQVEFVGASTKLFRFEDGLEKPVGYVCDVLGVDTPTRIPYSNKGPDIEVLVTETDCKKVQRFYQEDFVCFGYDIR